MIMKFFEFFCKIFIPPLKFCAQFIVNFNLCMYSTSPTRPVAFNYCNPRVESQSSLTADSVVQPTPRLVYIYQKHGVNFHQNFEYSLLRQDTTDSACCLLLTIFRDKRSRRRNSGNRGELCHHGVIPD